MFAHSTASLPNLPLDKPTHFTLDTAGVAGLLGGDEAVSAMATVHVYENRRWLGWYNSPGSYQIAKRLRSLAKSALFQKTFPDKFSQESPSESVHADPTTLFELDGWRGPKYRAAHSGTVMQETGYLAALFMKECASWDSEGRVIPGRKTQPVTITIAELGKAPAAEMCPTRTNPYTPIFAFLPTAASVGACALGAVYEDWYAFGLILSGVIASGVSSLVIGSADFIFTHPNPASGSPPGDGILTSDKDIVLLKGEEGAVNSITRGRFSLRFSKTHYRLINWSSLLLFIQFFAQLFLISQATLFGQLLFLASLAISALYNWWLSSWDKEKIQRNILFNSVLGNPKLTKYTLGTRTTAVVFMLLVLQNANPSALLDELLPNDTKVWRQWKKTVLEQLRDVKEQSFQFGVADWELSEFDVQEQKLLEQLYGDAKAAFTGYKAHLAHGVY